MIIINKNQKILIIPDIHNHFNQAETIIKKEKDSDLIIFLGDYFDDFNDTEHDIHEAAKWLHYSINQKNRIHLWGNHDSYGYNNKLLICSGFQSWKYYVIKSYVTKEDWQKAHYFIILPGNWLLTHAGLHPSWLPNLEVKTNEEIFEWLKNEEINVLGIGNILVSIKFIS